MNWHKRCTGLDGGRLFLVFLLLFFSTSSHQFRHVLAQNTTQVDVGVVLDHGSLAGQMSLTSISLAIDDFYAAHSNYSKRLVLHIRDSKQDIVGAASAAVDLLKNVQVEAIIAPLTSAQAEFVADIGSKTQVPILSSSATSPGLSSARTPYLIRTAVNDSAQVAAIVALVQYFGWREVVFISEDTDYGAGIIPYLVGEFQAIDTRVPYRSVIPTTASDDLITAELYKLMTMHTRVFVVHMGQALGTRIFTKAAQIGMMSQGYVWIITDGMANILSSLDAAVVADMEGVLGVRPHVPKNNKKLDDFTARLGAKKPTTFQLWAYDTAWALALAVEKEGAKIKNEFEKPRGRGADNTSDLAALGVSQAGPGLLDAIQKTRFHGLAGEFQLVDGQLQSSAFEIVNLIEMVARVIGFWTPSTRRLSRHLMTNSSSNSLKPIIWPGESMAVPKGWQIPTSEKKLRIGVPVKTGFNEFVNVEWDPITNATRVTGYCIDVFDTVMQTLPYYVPYEYVPFGNTTHGESPSYYNNLVYQVFLQNYDAVVGDMTITANRSNYVDFTFPYTESGVSMVVPVMAVGSKNAWIFSKPLTTDLWLGSLAFFVFTGFVVWVIEHRINNKFQGPPSQQLGVTFYFAFSTMVFSHKERLESNLSRLAVIIWVFVVLILTSSYTASLTSLLTVQQLQPTVVDVIELLKNGDNIGYQDGSFVEGLLKDNMKFNEAKLKSLSTPEQYADALTKGSKKGGVAAIFDEIPYLKLFLSGHCTDYTMIGRIYKTDGFGFVFPQGSPLVPDVSRAILKTIEGDAMTEIERKWFGDSSTCPAQGDSLSSTTLDLPSFQGLFLITGIVSLLALLIFFTIFLYKERKELKAAAPESSIWRRLIAWAKYYDLKDPESYSVKKEKSKSEAKSPSTVVLNQNEQASGGEALRDAEGSQSPFRNSNFSDLNYGPPEVEMSSTELGITGLEILTSLI